MALPDLESLPEWKELCLRYRYDITRFAVEVLDMQVTWQQDLLFRSIALPGSRTSVASGHGCFGIDTPIMLFDGTIKAVQDITLDDEIMGDDGESKRNVLALKRGRQAMYCFTYSDNTTHIFNESHILCLVATNTKGRRIAGNKITVTVGEWLKWGADKKRCHAIYRNSVKQFDNQKTELPIDPYILGLWLGDGESKGARIVTADHEIMEAWRDYAPKINCKFVYHPSGDQGLAKVYSISKLSASNKHINHFYHALKDLNLINNKHIPNVYLTADLESRKQLLAGLIDTDGSLDGCGYDFIQKNKNIAESACWLARSIGCHATIKAVKKKCQNNGVIGNYYRVTIGRNIDLIPVRITRKKRPEMDHQRRNLHFSIKNVECLGEGDYYGFVLDGNSQFLGGDFTVLHNTGKSRSAGVVALWHLLFFEHSVTLFTAPQITQLKKIVWKEIKICWNRMKAGSLSWLADYVKIFSQEVYIVGHQETWHVLAKTAPKHQPTNIAGEHGDNYLLWGDEASGIEDAIYDVIMGALTHEDNRAVLTSQPTRNTGFFYNTHHAWSHRAGGVWTALTLNGERSPLVSEKTIAEMLEKYGHKEDPGYQIRVLGRFPDRSDEFLVTMTQAEAMFKGDSLFKDAHDDWGYVITVDVGGGVGRDDSVIAVSKVWGNKQWGPDARRVEVVDIPLCKNRDNLHELTGIINECLVRYNNATLVVDDNGAGIGLGQHLKANGIWYKSAKWGGQCFTNDGRKEYANKRSQANVCLSRAIAQGRFKVKTNKYKVKFLDQLTRIPYYFDEYSRFKVMSKEDMKRKGLKSPDIADVFAFLFLEGVNYTEAHEVSYESDDTKTVVDTKKSKWAKLQEHAEQNL